MIPRFANPHTYSQSTSYVSRGELYTDSNVNEDANVAEEGVLSVLEQLVKRSLGEYISDHVDIPKEPTERKKKRRRVEENRMEVKPSGLQTTDRMCVWCITDTTSSSLPQYFGSYPVLHLLGSSHCFLNPVPF